MKNIEILIGTMFGSWTVIGQELIKNKHKVIEARCICGKVKYVHKVHLRSGMSKSCGCQVVSGNKTHGMTGHPVYRVWRAMLDRCLLKSSKSYYRYGGAGITVCEEWKKFEQFYSDMGDRPTSRHSIDRINNNKGYEPSNCRWATVTEQARNKKPTSSTKSGVVGVNQRKNGKWIARIGVDYQVINLGIFKDLESAISARKHGESTLWNKPQC